MSPPTDPKPSGLAASLRRDPRSYQIAVLASLLVYGIAALEFPVGLREVTLLVGTSLATQLVCGRIFSVRFDPRSPLISALSLSLLARAGSLPLLALTAVAAIASKFLIRRRGKHVFNPTNFGLVAMALVSGRVWFSPGQWGSDTNLAFLLACAGGLVVHRAAVSDVTWGFLTVYASVLFARAWWLGDPWAVPLHALDSGSLLLFAFFMISDPKTTPDTRAGRLLYAGAVAVAAAGVHFVLFRPNGFIWALAACAPLVPLIDRLLPGVRYRWPGVSPSPPPAPARRPPIHRRNPMRSRSITSTRAALTVAALTIVVAAAAPRGASAFCGFYVAKADAKLFNRASQVVLVRHDDKTVLTMANDFRGDPHEFAIVVPVPTFLEREQIHVADQGLIDHLDAYTAPRLVEYFDPDPCSLRERKLFDALEQPAGNAVFEREQSRSLGVTVEAKYTVGEYDILILSAEESRGLETWLRQNGYRIPEGASRVLGSYLRQGMRFFVARVNLEEHDRLGFANLRPLQVAYETPKFMLPIRLGMVNADGPQELFVYTLTRKGRVETTNYRTVRLPTGMDLPVFVKSEFSDFYRDLFTTQVEKNGMRSVFLEYAWDMNWCDPCAADPLSVDQLRRLGVFWLDETASRGPAREVFVTRLHVRYDEEHFPDDLRFHETADRTNFQGRYVLRHPAKGSQECPLTVEYRRELARRFEREAQTLANLTGWELGEIRRKMRIAATLPPEETTPWWRRVWGRGQETGG